MARRLPVPGRLAILALASAALVAGLVTGVRWSADDKALGVNATLRAGWFASRVDAHLLRFLAAFERFAAGAEADRDRFLDQIDVLLLAVQRLVREPDGAALMTDRRIAVLGLELEDRLAELEPELLAFEPGDEAAASRIRAGLARVREPSAELVNRAYRAFLEAAGAAERRAAEQSRLLTASLALAAAGGILLLVLLVGAVREARRARHREADAASRAREAEVSLRTLVDALPVAVTALDEHGRIRMLNRHASELAGVPEAAALGKRPQEAGLPAPLTAEPGAGSKDFVEMPLERPGRGRRVLLSTARTVRRDDGSLARTVHIALDLTERRMAEEQLRQLAEQDVLTGLANRARLHRALASALARPNGRAALLLLDLDGFKEVNDSLGHPTGDRLLVAVAGRLVGAAGPRALVARLGGDEFAVLQPDPPDEAAVRDLAAHLVASLDRPIVVPEARIRVGASVGVAIAPQHGRDADELMRHADIALYRAKGRARGSIVLFTPDLALAQARRHRIATRLEAALARGALDLHFQPIVRLADRAVVACEALLRWPGENEEDRPSPAELVTVAEESGLVAPLTEWVLLTACQRARDWQRAGRGRRVAVNLSMTPDLLDRLEDVVASVLTRTGLQPDLLELEVTEGVLIRNFEQATTLLGRLRRRGITIALDDFGTGYSSLAYLHRFPLDKLKIDRRFTDDLDRLPVAVPIVETIVRLGHALGLTIVAEGVERPSQLAILRELGCDQAQGYLLGRPQPAESLDGPAPLALRPRETSGVPVPATAAALPT